MELDFDKEINALLRQAARSGEFVSTNEQNHLDADEISAFAENALPEKTRNVYIKHFADCDRCRTILSNTILLNNEAEMETASSVVAAPIAGIVAEKIPWYRKMFLMPNHAYTMGALVLVFGGMLGFIALQSINQTGSSDVSQIQKEESPASGPNASDDAVSYNSNAAASNSNAMASSTATSNSTSNATASASNSTVSNTQPFSSNQALTAPSAPTETLKQGDTKPSDDALLSAKNESRDFEEAELSERKKAEELNRNEDLARSTTDSVIPPPSAAKAAPKPVPAQPSITAKSAEDLPLNSRRIQNLPQTAPTDSKKDRALSRANNNNSRQIGGKTFNRVGGVWIDSAYNKYDGMSTNAALPQTRTIRRGSSEYQNLDRQVRIIAESLDGAVIIVWRDGAYRIQ